jgi:hypothetical protein
VVPLIAFMPAGLLNGATYLFKGKPREHGRKRVRLELSVGARLCAEHRSVNNPNARELAEYVLGFGRVSAAGPAAAGHSRAPFLFWPTLSIAPRAKHGIDFRPADCFSVLRTL